MQVKSSGVAAARPETGWVDKGACARVDPELFFGPDGEQPIARGRRESAAVAVCRACPVQPECRIWALAVRIPYGVWGGLTERGRLAVLADASVVAA